MKSTNKCKRITKKGRDLIIIEGQKGQSTNLREVEDIQNGVMPHVVPVELIEKHNKFTLVYDVTNYITLEQYIHTLLNQKKFSELIRQILWIFRDLTNACYNTKNLILDLDKVMVNPGADQVYFLYVPILYYDFSVQRQDFLVQLIYHTTFDGTEDTHYVGHCLDILQKSMNFSAVELEEYLERLCPLELEEIQNVRQNHVAVDIEYHPLGLAQEAEKTQKKIVFEEKEQQVSIPKQEKPEAVSTKMTGCLSDIGSGDTILLGSAEKAYIRQVRTGETFYIEGNSISLGKKQCDVSISDNAAISRKHAVLCKISDRFYLKDENSTNGTRVNGERVQPGQQAELKDEDMFELANEKFIFYR